MSANMEKQPMNSLEMDREVIRCKTCGLVQYRTRTGNCRRCVRALPQRMEYLIPEAPPPEQAEPEAAASKFANQETVENIGQRIRQLRESRGMTQSQLQARSKVSRSYLSRSLAGAVSTACSRRSDLATTGSSITGEANSGSGLASPMSEAKNSGQMCTIR